MCRPGFSHSLSEYELQSVTSYSVSHAKVQIPTVCAPPAQPHYLVINSSNLELVRFKLDQWVSATGLCSGGPR